MRRWSWWCQVIDLINWQHITIHLLITWHNKALLHLGWLVDFERICRIILQARCPTSYLTYWNPWTSERWGLVQHNGMGWLLHASHKDQTWYVQFPSCCAKNMELSTATSPFTNHQPRSVLDWTQIPTVQVRLHMTTSKNYSGVN